MNERFIYLLEGCLNGSLSAKEENELKEIRESDNALNKEFKEQKRIKEVLNKMKLKNPSDEIWDSYWIKKSNQIERGIIWMTITIGALLLIAYVSYNAVEKFLENTNIPFIVKFGIGFLVLGFLFLLFSTIKEKIITRSGDKYKEIQR